MGVKLSSSLINTISVTQHFFNAFYISEVANDNPFSLISTVVLLPLGGSHLHCFLLSRNKVHISGDLKNRKQKSSKLRNKEKIKSASKHSLNVPNWGHSFITFSLKGGGRVHQNANVCKQGEGGCANANIHLIFFQFST